MITTIQPVLALFLLSNLIICGTGRLRQATRLVALQGLAIGILTFLIPYASSGDCAARTVFLGTVNATVKGIVLPMLVLYAAKRAKTDFELEPLVPFTLSLAIGFAITCAAFILAKNLSIPVVACGGLAIATAFTTAGCGLFLICSRRKAITQVLAFLMFENGITLFGVALMLEYDLIVELGILLDVFVLVFVLGIAINHINRTFSSLDTDKLNKLDDTHLFKAHHD